MTFDLLDWPDYLALTVIAGLGITLIVNIVRDVWRHRGDE